jgi:hypothetical protein
MGFLRVGTAFGKVTGTLPYAILCPRSRKATPLRATSEIGSMWHARGLCRNIRTWFAVASSLALALALDPGSWIRDACSWVSPMCAHLTCTWVRLRSEKSCISMKRRPVRCRFSFTRDLAIGVVNVRGYTLFPFPDTRTLCLAPNVQRCMSRPPRAIGLNGLNDGRVRGERPRQRT